jgi:hypothetical protein
MTLTRLRWSEVLRRLKRGIPFLEPFHGSPPCELSVSPNEKQIIFKIKAKDAIKALSTHSKIEILAAKGGKEIHLRCSDRDLFSPFYEICSGIADAVQIDKRKPFRAIRESLERFERILQKRKTLKKEFVLGLIGELYFFNELLISKNVASVYKYWTGIQSEEHDFTCPKDDYEIKTTTKEIREHRISSLTQLLPKHKRKLYLISYQLTPGLGSKSFSLNDLLCNIKKSPNGAEIWEKALNKIEVNSENILKSPEAQKKYVLRGNPCCFLVDSDFPKITNRTLKSNLQRLNDVTYNIVLENFSEDSGFKTYKNRIKLI